MREHSVNTNGTGACHGARMAQASCSALKMHAFRKTTTHGVNLAAAAAPSAGRAEATGAKADTPPNPQPRFLPGRLKSVGRISGGRPNTAATGREPGVGSGWGLGTGMEQRR